MFVVDCVRNPRQLRPIREKYAGTVTLVHLTSPDQVLAGRYRDRGGDRLSYNRATKHPSESRVHDLRELADIVIDTEFNDPQHVCDIITAHMLSDPSLVN